MKEVITTPSKTITVSFNDATYTINFPTNGQLIDIERLKIQMTQDTQRSLMYGSSAQAERAFMIVEAIATFTILIPALKKDLKVAGLTELTPIETKQMVNAYVKVFYPWYKAWFDIINADDEEAKEDVEQAKNE